MTSEQKSLPELKKLEQALENSVLPPELKERIQTMLESLSRGISLPNYSQELETTERYVDWVLNLPWAAESRDNLDLARAKKILETNHYALTKIKERILEYMAVLNLTAEKVNRESAVLCFTGLPGLGKTSAAASIAQALGRNFVRIPFGGLGEVSQIRGLPRYLPSSEPGQVIKNLRRVKSRNPVILLDEIDRVADSSRGVIMGALLELLDPEQNGEFTDYFIDYPFDLSKVLFICTANNTRGIANAVLDRLEIIEMPSYTDEEKIIIGRDYLLPKALSSSGLRKEQVKIEESLWPKIVRPLGFDAGIRTLERTLLGICRKIARMVVEGKGREFSLNEGNIKEFLPTW
ncbi:MAG: AAA family ATPase [Patescibacteria group bacterium]|nr:AAA family ATPase [Patescibacteria group bacterium]